MLEIEISKGGAGKAPSMGADDKMKALDYLETMLDDARAKCMAEDGMQEDAMPEGEMSEEQERKLLEG